MRKAVALATGLLTAVAFMAGSAEASRRAAPAAASCSSWQSTAGSAFDSLGALQRSGAAARGLGGEVGREPSLNETYTALPDTAKGKGGKSFRVTVPVWFHVITDGATGNVSQKAIDDQLAVLNLGYSGFYGGADTGFRFRLVGVDRTDNAAWFAARAGGSDEREMKRALRRGGNDTLNLYSSLAGGYLGYAYLPGLPASRTYLDGIVFHWESMPGTSTRFAGRYDLGFTLVHESGHWFDLEHTFFGGCNAKGDFVDDTPAMLVPTSGCPPDNTKDTCPKEPGFDPIHNFMDYSYDACYTQFTPGQAARQQDAWLYFRA